MSSGQASDRGVTFPFGSSPGLTIGQGPRSNSLSSHQSGRVENFVSDLSSAELAQSSGLSESILSAPQNLGSVRTWSVSKTVTKSDQTAPDLRPHKSPVILVGADQIQLRPQISSSQHVVRSPLRSCPSCGWNRTTELSHPHRFEVCAPHRS